MPNIGGGITFDCCLWALLGPEGGRAHFLKMCIQFNILDPILICVPNIWGSYQLWLLSLGPVGPWGGEGTISKNVYTIQHSWSYPDLCAKHLGELSTFIVVFGPCRALRGEGISKMCVQFNILDPILIFVWKTQLSALEHRQLGFNICPGPNSPGPSCLGPNSAGPSCLGPICPGPSWLGPNCPGANLPKAVRVCVYMCANTEIQLLSLRPSGGV